MNPDYQRMVRLIFPVDTIFFSYENNVIFRIDENNPQ